jgi:hypothetical protein
LDKLAAELCGVVAQLPEIIVAPRPDGSLFIFQQDQVVQKAGRKLPNAYCFVGQAGTRDRAGADRHRSDIPVGLGYAPRHDLVHQKTPALQRKREQHAAIRQLPD